MNLSTFALIALGLGIIAMLVTSILIKPDWPRVVQFIAAIVVSVATGAAQVAVNGQLDHLRWDDMHSILGAAALVFAASQVAFHGIYKGTKVQAWVEDLISWERAHRSEIDAGLALIAKADPVLAARVQQLRADIPAQAPPPAAT